MKNSPSKAEYFTTKQDFTILEDFADIAEDLNSDDESQYLKTIFSNDYNDID